MIQIVNPLDENIDASVTLFHDYKALSFSNGAEKAGITLARLDWTGNFSPK
jgi:hypothetical protein